MTRQAATLSSLFEGDKFRWLDRVAEPLQDAALRLFQTPAGREAKKWLNGTPLRHRVHPALIIVPLGAWTTAALLDCLDARGGDRGPERGADAAVAFGVVGALPTAAAGLADWADLHGHPRRVGALHALLNTTALALYGTSLGLRAANKRGPARATAALGYGVVMLGGALGGELVYTLGVNVPVTLYPKPPNAWVDVLASPELMEGARRVVEVERVPTLLLRHGGQVYAVEAWCPHAGGPLGEGEFAGPVVTCPWHGSRFDLMDGRPLEGPASVPLRTYAVRESGDRIAVRPDYEGQSWPPPPAPPQTAVLRAVEAPAIEEHHHGHPGHGAHGAGG